MLSTSLMELRMPQIHGPIQHLRRSLGPGPQTIQAIHGPPTLGPVVVPVIGNRTRGPSPRKHGVGQRGNPSGEGTKQVGKIGLDGRKNGRPGRVQILWKALGGSATLGVGDGADFYCKAGREKQSEGNILKIPRRFDHGSCMAPAQGTFVTFFKPSVSYSHLNGLIWAVR